MAHLDFGDLIQQLILSDRQQQQRYEEQLQLQRDLALGVQRGSMSALFREFRELLAQSERNELERRRTQRELERERAERQRELKQQHQAATLLQAAYRGHRLREQLKQQHRAATLLQAAYRGHRLREQLKQQHQAATILQTATLLPAAYRGPVDAPPPRGKDDEGEDQEEEEDDEGEDREEESQPKRAKMAAAVESGGRAKMAAAVESGGGAKMAAAGKNGGRAKKAAAKKPKAAKAKKAGPGQERAEWGGAPPTLNGRAHVRECPECYWVAPPTRSELRGRVCGDRRSGPRKIEAEWPGYGERGKNTVPVWAPFRDFQDWSPIPDRGPAFPSLPSGIPRLSGEGRRTAGAD